MIQKDLLLKIGGGVVGAGTIGVGIVYTQLGRNVKEECVQEAPTSENKNKLNLPKECLETNGTYKDCQITGSYFKNLVDVEGGTGNLEVTGLQDSEKIDLKVKKICKVGEEFPDELVFHFEGFNNKITLTKGNKSENLVPNTNPEFKLNTEKNKLVKAWDVYKFGLKVNLNCSTGTGHSGKTCSLPTTVNDIKVFDHPNQLVKTNGVSAVSGKIEYEDDQQNYNQGLKIKIKQDIEDKSDGEKKNLSQGDYEIVREGCTVGYCLKLKST